MYELLVGFDASIDDCIYPLKKGERERVRERKGTHILGILRPHFAHIFGIPQLLYVCCSAQFCSGIFAISHAFI